MGSLLTCLSEELTPVVRKSLVDALSAPSLSSSSGDSVVTENKDDTQASKRQRFNGTGPVGAAQSAFSPSAANSSAASARNSVGHKQSSHSPSNNNALHPASAFATSPPVATPRSSSSSASSPASSSSSSAPDGADDAAAQVNDLVNQLLPTEYVFQSELVQTFTCENPQCPGGERRRLELLHHFSLSLPATALANTAPPQSSQTGAQVSAASTSSRSLSAFSSSVLPLSSASASSLSSPSSSSSSPPPADLDVQGLIDSYFVQGSSVHYKCLEKGCGSMHVLQTPKLQVFDACIVI
jgi:hypothetical protein